MYGYFGDLDFYGDFGAASDSYKTKIDAQKAKIKKLREKAGKEVVFTYGRKQAELAVRAAVVVLRTLESKYRKAKRDEAQGKGKGKGKGGAASSGDSGLTQEQIDQITALVKQLIDAGVDADAAEEQVKARVLPAKARFKYPRGFFRPVLDRRGPRPALPPRIPPVYRPMPGEFSFNGRPIDPRPFTRVINPRLTGRNLGPFPPGRNIDPMVPQIPLLLGTGAQAGSFTFAPGNISDTDPSLDAEIEDDLSGGFDLSASNPWVLGGLALAAIYLAPKLFRKGKATTVKSNPRRRRNRR